MAYTKEVDESKIYSRKTLFKLLCYIMDILVQLTVHFKSVSLISKNILQIFII